MTACGTGRAPRRPPPNDPGRLIMDRRRGSLAERLDTPGIGEEIHALAAGIYPICRSITGPGVRKTLAVLARQVALEVHELPTGAPVFDWTVPREWTLRGAHIRTAGGETVIDLGRSNLHVMSYSAPVSRRMTLAELAPHVFTLPDQPGLIPYRTSYYKEDWGFCMAHDQFTALADGLYDVMIDATLADGSLTYGEYLHRGETEDEFLISTHICHPSLANDNCSGLALATILAHRLASLRTRYSYRFLFVPGTIGSLCWLSRNEGGLHRIKHGLVLSCVGDGGGPTYKKSRQGDAVIDRVMAATLQRMADAPAIIDFFPYGYDERQYCAPGFDLPVGLFQRSRFGTFPEYHTSADDLDFIRPDHLASSFRMIAAAIDAIETEWRPVSLVQKGEPQLGRRGLYAAIGGHRAQAADGMAMLWVLNLADGRHSLDDMARRSGMPADVIAATARLLVEHGLLAAD